jgi:glycine oxidase
VPSPTDPPSSPDLRAPSQVSVHVVGAGVIGLACAWRLSQNGHTVTVVAPDPGGPGGASHVAAGMLAPVTEAQFGESDLTALLLEGAAHWPAFAADLAAAGGDIGYDTTGTVTVALDASDRAHLDDLLAYQHSLGLTAHRRSASECRRLVPALSPTLRGGIEVPGDHQVDNRALLRALLGACRRSGVTFVESSVRAVAAGPVLVLADGDRLGTDRVVLAAGVGLASIDGLAAAGLPRLRPVKGHTVRLGPVAGSGPPLLSRTVRGLVRGHSVYLVPRPDGSLVVGATVEERSDTTVQAGAVHELLCDARALVPGIDELELLEASAGLRPATPDNTPRIGWTALDGVAVATGHYRNGILLAPLTAATVVDLLAGPTRVAGGIGRGAAVAR